MKCEKLISDMGIEVEIIPTPAVGVGDCGVSLKIFEDDYEKVNILIDSCGVIERILEEKEGVYSKIEIS
jgi:hypothetical protein